MQPCPSCKIELPENANYCTRCGYALNAQATVKLRRALHTSDQSTPSPNAAAPHSRHRISRILSAGVQSIIAWVQVRAQDSAPEKASLKVPQKFGASVTSWGWVPALALTSTSGVFSVAYAYTTARNGATGVDIFFWFGLLLIFVPVALRLIAPGASRVERLYLLCIVSLCFYLVNVLYDPLAFTNHDAFQHWSTAENIVTSGHLFTENALLPVSPFYPGLEIVTTSLSMLSGLSIFYAGVIVIGVARLLLILSLFMLCDRLTKSARIAGIAALLYMTNSHFLFYDSQFLYESLALPLATFMLFALAEYEKFRSNYYWIVLIALGAVVITHHLTDYIFDALLLLWTIASGFLGCTALYKNRIGKITLFGIVASLAWITLRGNPVVVYLSSYVASGIDELVGVLKGSGARHLFSDYAGQQTPLWERLMAASYLSLIVLGLPFGLLCLWKRYRSNALVWMFGITALSFPIIQIFRLTSRGYEIADRPISFLFIPISCILAIAIAQFWPTRRLRWQQMILITTALSVMFLGGVVLGIGPSWELLPGPYLVGAHERSIEPEGINAALWAHTHLGPDNRMATDLNNQLLMGTYGDQRIVTPEEDQIDVTDVFFSLGLSSYDQSLLQQAKVRYLVVDRRLSTSLPRIGFYFEETEPGAFERTTPISLEALTKFNTVPQVDRVFDSGNIIIYDVGGLINAPEKP